MEGRIDLLQDEIFRLRQENQELRAENERLQKVAFAVVTYHTLKERNLAIWSQQNRKTGTQNTFVLFVKPSVFKGCRGRAIF